jgi:hypothetical protein
VTAKSLAGGAVTAPKIRKGAVTFPKLAKASVTPEAIAGDAVTAGAIAPGSVEAAMLAERKVVTKPIVDVDKVAHNGEWTASSAELAQCAPGEAAIGGGFSIPNPTGGEIIPMQAFPVVSGETQGFMGRIEGDSGGAASAEVAVICLK